jgi:excisionase family DNA binding protein
MRLDPTGPIRLSEPLLTADEVAALLAIRRSTVYELARTGQLPSIKIGRHLRFTRGMLEAALSAQHG